MVSFASYKDSYNSLWNALDIRSSKTADARKQAERILEGKAQYQAIERRTGVPWWFVGLCHYREANCNFAAYLGNGQLLNRCTTIVPKGRGPFTGPNAFLDGAVDALTLERLVGAQDWSIARVLYRLEGFNGYGYHAKGVNSPYLWGGSTAYGPPEALGGKYVRDHDFESQVVDSQLGTAVILRTLIELDDTIELDGSQGLVVGAIHDPEEELADNTLWVQQSLNRLGAVPQLTEDGRNGRNTKAAVSHFQSISGLADTGLADVRTIAAIQNALHAATAPNGDFLAKRVTDLETRLEIRTLPRIPPRTSAPEPAPQPALPSLDVSALVARLDLLLPKLELGAGSIISRQGEPAATQPAVDDLTAKLGDLVQQLVAVQLAAPGSSPGDQPRLGQINGALGTTIGNLVNGKKTAIGIIGAIATQILSQVPPGTGLGQVLAQLTPAFGLSPYTLPIFLGLTAWGALGKLEKLTPTTAAQPAKIPPS